MKKKTIPISIYFKMPYLRFNDLQRIESVICDELKPDKYFLETKEYEYDSIKELPKNTGTTTNFQIRTTSPYISIDLNRSSSHLYASDDTLEVRGVISKISEIIRSRERKFLYYSSQIAQWIAPLFCMSLFLGSISLLRKTYWDLWGITLFALSFLSGYWWWISFKSSLNSFSIVELDSKKMNFLTRNKDQLIVGIIIAIITATLTLLGEKLLKNGT